MTDKEICIEFIDGKAIGAVGKRFNYDYHDEKIIDNQTGKTYGEDNYHMLVIDGLLNQLNDENEQLKIELKDCHKSNHEYYRDKDKLIRLCERFNIDWKKELEE